MYRYMASSWPAPELLDVREAGDGRGRGLFATQAIVAGSAVLCEIALASSKIDDEAASWPTAAELAAAVLEIDAQTDVLERLDHEAPILSSPSETNAYETVAKQLASDNAISDGTARHLLNAVARNALSLCGHQGARLQYRMHVNGHGHHG